MRYWQHISGQGNNQAASKETLIKWAFYKR